MSDSKRDPWYPGGDPDAMHWVEEFDRTYPDRRPDNDTMLGWFANAIETGRMVGARAADPPASADVDAAWEALNRDTTWTWTDLIAKHRPLIEAALAAGRAESEATGFILAAEARAAALDEARAAVKAMRGWDSGADHDVVARYDVLDAIDALRETP